MFRRGSEKDASKVQLPPQPPPDTFAYHVYHVKLASSHPNSIQYRFSIKSFLNFVDSQYRLQTSMNNEQHFITEIFAATSLSSMNNNPTLYLLFLTLFIDANIGSKLSKAMRITRELPQLPPSKDPNAISYLERILKWLSNSLGTTLNLTLQPLRDKIWAWYCSPDEDTIIAAMDMLDLFLREFPSAMTSSFENINSLLIRSLQHQSHYVTKKAAKALSSALKLLNSPYSLHIETLCNTIVKNLVNESNPPSANFVKAILWVLSHNKTISYAFNFESPPLPDVSQKNQSHLICLLPIALFCSPEIFHPPEFEFYFAIFDKIDFNKCDTIIFKSLGHFGFLLGQQIQDYPQRIHLIKKIQASHVENADTSFALLSLLSPRDDNFHAIVDSILERPNSASSMSSFVRYCQLWPQKATQIRNRILPILSSSLILQTSKLAVISAFDSMTQFNFNRSELSIHLLFQYRSFLNDSDFEVRKSAVMFLLSQQKNFPEIKMQLISYISTEVSEPLRLTVIDSIEPSDELVEPLYALLHDRIYTIRYSALQKLCTINSATSLISDYISELVQIVDHTEALNGPHIYCLLITTQQKSSLVRPFAQFLLRRLLQVQNLKSSSLRLIANLLQFASSSTDLCQLANHIDANLSLHATAKRINATLELLASSLKFTNFRSLIINDHPSIISRLFELSKNQIESHLLLNLIEKIGAINTTTMKAIISGSKVKSATQSLLGALTLINQKSSDSKPETFMTNTAVFVSLSILLNIMNEESLSTLHSSAIEALLAILLSYKDVGEGVEEILLDKIHTIILNSGSGTVAIIMQNIISLLTVFGDKLAPLLPHIIDIVCNNWGKLDTSLLLRTIEWISVRVPEIFAHHIYRVVTLFLSDIKTQSPKVVNEIFQKFISFGHLMKTVDYLIIPALLSWIEIQSDNDIVVIEALLTLREIMIYSNCHRYCSEVIRTLNFICQRNERLIQSAGNVIIVIGIQMGENFLVYLQEIASIFDLKILTDLKLLINCLSQGQPIPTNLLTKFTEIGREPKKSESTLTPSTSNKNKIKRTPELPQFKLPSDDWDSFEWSYWFDDLVTVFLSTSPSKAITSCAALAEKNIAVRNSLFPITYAFCCALKRTDTQLMQVLVSVLIQPQVPVSIVRHFMTVVEYLEINSMPIPIPWSILGEKASVSGLLPQAIRYTEYAFIEDQQHSAEDLIFLNLNLGLQLAASGVLRCANVDEFQENLSERLGLWDDALVIYDERLEDDPTNEEFRRGKMKCLEQLSRFKDLEQFVGDEKSKFAASAAFHLFKIDKFIEIASCLDSSNNDNLFYIIILKIIRNDLDEAETLIDKLNTIYGSKLFPLIADEYEKCFSDFCQASILSELREIIEMKRNEPKRFSAVPTERNVASAAFEKICTEWRDRFEHLRSTPKELFEMICIRSLYLDKKRIDSYFYEFLELEANLNGMTQLAEIAFDKVDKNDYEVKFAECLMHKRDLASLVAELPESSPLLPKYLCVLGDCYISEGSLEKASVIFQKTIQYLPNSPLVWMKWSKINISLYESSPDPEILKTALEATLTGLTLSPPNPMLFTLRVISIIFQHGSTPLYSLFESYLTKIPINYWISLLPQIIAKLSSAELNKILERLLLMLADSHPQTVLYSLMVPYLSESVTKGPIATSIIDRMRTKTPTLVNEAILLASEMRRIASSWWETWVAAIDETSKQFVLHKNPQATIDLLLPLHELVSRPPETLFEVSFVSQFGSMLLQAEELIKDYKDTSNMLSFHQAWSIYVNIFRIIKPMLTQMNDFDLSDASVSLAESIRNTELTIPGTYNFDKPLIRIESVCEDVIIINSKQRPRRISLRGTDGNLYSFLLKPNEDTRLDERVMQLFTYISDVIKASDVPLASNLCLTAYRVVPLSKKVGLIGWVTDTQTLFEVIRHYRMSIGRNANAEMTKIAKYCPNYDSATLEQRERAFLLGIKATPGDDIRKVTLKYSTDSADWLERRTIYTTSLATTSMAGYILGLGDRHLSNIMVTNRTMKLVHIDFGDCFEVAMHRSRYPEKVPFRLSPLMVNALEVSKIEGTFRLCCENVMQIMRENGEQIMALLEAFIYDPLLQWTTKDANDLSAIKIIGRIRDKLTGDDFDKGKMLSVSKQVDLLIHEATNPKNLCQMFQGWCPFW
ncbi:PIKK family atypical protein kinase [Tritrichomonas foetus]|uniref:non-specific serine/threonine protein kinase n=1 Tax=Tritrichomonas foetus TaxID=1144522 RepID=A0A1J4K3W3_9EUKA|nr:PIKK family atypical protein kinase [Tritrichomonas foetus]|eukprot:OHT05528.1 PIKK family atypical protein kinase [Tritrichomonas foetus]